MPADRSAMVAEQPTRSRGGHALLIIGLLLAMGAAGALVVTDDLRWARLGIVAALWAALVGAFLAARYRGRLSDRDEHAADLQAIYELELEREIAARREYELQVEAEIRSEVEEKSRQDLTALREEMHTLRQTLQGLLGGEVLVERYALHAQSTRMRALAEERQLRPMKRLTAGSSQPQVVPEPITEQFAPVRTAAPAGPQSRPGNRFDSGSESRLEPTPDPRFDPRSENRMEPRLDPRSETRLDPRSETRPDPRAGSRFDPRSESRLDPVSATGPQSRPGNGFDPGSESRLDPRSDPRFETLVEPTSDTRFDPRSETRLDPRSGSRFDPRSESRLEPPPVAGPRSRPETRPEPRIEPRIESRSEPRLQPPPEPRPAPTRSQPTPPLPRRGDRAERPPWPGPAGAEGPVDPPTHLVERPQVVPPRPAETPRPTDPTKIVKQVRSSWEERLFAPPPEPHPAEVSDRWFMPDSFERETPAPHAGRHAQANGTQQPTGGRRRRAEPPPPPPEPPRRHARSEPDTGGGRRRRAEGDPSWQELASWQPESGSHSQGNSVADLLAMHGGQGPRRRRRREE